MLSYLLVPQNWVGGFTGINFLRRAESNFV